MDIDFGRLAFNDAGLIPAIVQDATSGGVLMLGWMNTASLEATQRTGLVHFWSRSRNELWQKGETSGNTLSVASVAVDCDGDALLVTATPAGPTCHTGATSCFGDTGPSFGRLGELWNTIADRARTRPDGSYTTTLLEGGVDATARKLTEEATEVLLAAKDHVVGGPIDRLVEESADLLYHLLVVWAERGVSPELVMAELDARSSR